MRLLVTRPKEDAASLVEILKEKGHQPVLFPLLRIEREADGEKQLKDYTVKDVQALLVTSANGVRAFAEADKRRSFHVLAVGAASGDAARAAGFKHVDSAEGDVHSLAEVIKQKCQPDKGTLLHIAGSHVAGDLKGLMEKDGFDFARVVLYRSEKTTAFSETLIKDMKVGKIDGVLLYSPRTATSFAELVKKAGLEGELKRMTAYGLSDAVAANIKHLSFKETKVAATPDQDALLSLIAAPGEENMTQDKKDNNKKTDEAKKEAPKQADSKVIDAKAEDVKIKDAPKGNPDAKPGAKPAGTEDKGTQDKSAQDKSKVEDPVEKALKSKADAPAKKGLSFKAKAMVAGVVIIAGAGTATYFTQNMWVPKVKAEIAQALNIETVPSATGVTPDDLSAVLDRLAALENRPVAEPVEPTPAVDLQPLQDRLSALEDNLKALKQEVSTIEIANGSEDKLAEFQELANRLETVEGAKQVDLSGLEAEAERLSSLVQELNVRLSDVETARVEARNNGETIQALIAGLSALRQKMQTSMAYAAELQALSVLAQGDVVLEQAVDKLQAHAASGLASFSALEASFKRSANDIVRAAAVPESAGWVEQTVKNITSLVTIRRAPGNLEGDGPLGVVARADHNIQAGDFAAAVAELNKLSGKPLEAATPWIEAAQARLQGNETLSLMQSHILSLMPGAGGQG